MSKPPASDSHDPEDAPQQQTPGEPLPGLDRPQPSILVEFLQFLQHNKKWWLLPLVLSLLILGLLVVLSGSGAFVFLYPVG